MQEGGGHTIFIRSHTEYGVQLISKQSTNKHIGNSITCFKVEFIVNLLYLFVFELLR